MFRLILVVFPVVVGCGEPECRVSDECQVNEVCRSGSCERPFLKLPGVLLPGSVTTPCTTWNHSKTGAPAQLIRLNDECQSELEVAVKCDKEREWIYVCR